MKSENLHDALNYLDDDLIESADKVRSAPRRMHIKPARTIAAAVCACIALGAALLLAKFISPELTTDGANTVDGLDGATDTLDIPTVNDGRGVTLEKIAIDQSFGNSTKSITYFCRGGRIYIPYREITAKDYSKVIGDRIGTVTNVFASKPHGDYCGEMCGNMAYDVYTMKDYDEDFMLAVNVDGSYYIYVNDNGITLCTGADIFDRRLKLSGGYSSVSMRLNGSEIYAEPIDAVHHKTVDSFIHSLFDAPVIKRSELESLMIDAALQFTHNSGTSINVYFYNGGYVCVDVGAFSDVCVKPDAAAYDSFINWLKSISFDPEAFGERIPTPLGEMYLFYHKIFPGSTYLYFYSDAHFYPDPGTSPDKTAIKVYYTDSFGSIIDTVRLDFPSGFDTSYNSAKPIYVGAGGGSGECSIIIRLDYANETVYVSFDNFSYTDNALEFEYGGVVDKAFIEQEKAMDASRFHISELLSDIVIPTTILSPKEQTGLYQIGAGGSYQMIVQFITDQSDESLLAALGVGRGFNSAQGYIDMIKFNVTAGNECDPSGKYFIYTPSGAIELTRSEVIHVLTLSGAPIAKEPYEIIDEFGKIAEVTMHTYGGRVMPVSAEPYDLKLDGRYVYIPAEDNFCLNVYITSDNHPTGYDAVYVPLTATLEALGLDVKSENGKIIAEGALSYIQSPIKYASIVPEDANHVLAAGTIEISVNGVSAEYRGRVISQFAVMSSVIELHSCNDIFIYDGKYYIQPEFLAKMLGMETDYISEFFTKD